MWRPQLPLKDNTTRLEAAADRSSVSSQPALFYPLLLLFLTVLKFLSLFLDPDIRLHYVLSKVGSLITSRGMPRLYIIVQCFVPSAPQVSALITQLWVRRCQVFNGSCNWQGRQRSVFKELFLKPAGKCKNLPCFDTVICLHVVLYT